MPDAPPAVVAGVFVGGAGSRMGGVAKGLLRTAAGTTLLERWRAVLDGLGLTVVLVGDRAPYAGVGLEVVRDEPEGIGPLGGLVGLLRRGAGGRVLALAVDMPFVSDRLVARLLAAPAEVALVAPRRAGRWEPLCARYDAAAILPLAIARARGTEHSLQRLLDDAAAVELPLAPDEADGLRDWDTPEDVRDGGGH
jgi:molybdopterin-guanine dinucleotide biosynthesis protein A